MSFGDSWCSGFHMDTEYRGDGSMVEAGENLDCSTGRLRWPGGRVSERCSRNLLICECNGGGK